MSAAVGDMLEELAGIQGVRGALIATADGAFDDGRTSGLDEATATDVAKTVRRMVVASSTVGAPLEELSISFGKARLMIIPVREDATLAVFVERPQAVAAVRTILRVEVESLRELLASPDDDDDDDDDAIEVDEGDDEVDRLLAGELGPVLRKIQKCYVRHAERMNVSPAVATASNREQLREWLLCCNPSPYTFPLLLDGLSQTLNAAPEVRGEFMGEVQDIMRSSGEAGE